MIHAPSNRGRIAIFIDGNNLFHAARSAGVEIDYAKLLTHLRGEDPLLRAFFYTGVDQQAERQQGFLLWMRRNGYRVVQKELKTFPDGTKKANLDVEIAVDMLSLADKYDTAILVSGDEDFTYALNVIAYKGVRVEVAGFRANTSPRLIDVADRFHELDGIVADISKSPSKRDSQQTEALRLSGEWSLTPDLPRAETGPEPGKEDGGSHDGQELDAPLVEQPDQPCPAVDAPELLASLPQSPAGDPVPKPESPLITDDNVIVATLQSGEHPMIPDETWEASELVEQESAPGGNVSPDIGDLPPSEHP
ncbi:NYN domain-containing protein [Chloracidobacterium validum]|uniref:NYN domain-containing protein n=1 Tax=Chloracidobacterium validum TaxID=2821543 RepID=A0ABX8BCZ0_9BACT|nr:NYN domain-containing protein [Chloracidobacterium validum]